MLRTLRSGNKNTTVVAEIDHYYHGNTWVYTAQDVVSPTDGNVWQDGDQVGKAKLPQAKAAAKVVCCGEGLKSFKYVEKKILVAHQQNVNCSSSKTQSCQILWWPSSVLLSNSRCFQTPLEHCKVLSEPARALSGESECTCSNGCAFGMVQYLTIWIVNFGICCGLYADLPETSSADATSAQFSGRLQE